MKQNLKFTADLDSMTTYIEQNADVLVRAVVGSSKLATEVNFVPDMALGYIREIPYLNSEWTLKGGTCSTYANGGTFSADPITLTGKIVIFEQDLCLESMRNYFFGPYAAKDINDNTIPFEADFLNHGMAKIGKQLNQLFWQGGMAGDQTITGIIDQAVSAGAAGVTASSFAVSTSFDNGILLTFDRMANKLSADMLGQDDLTLYVGTKELLAYAQSLRNVNNYHLDPKTVQLEGTFLYAHPNVKIVPQIGLSGTGLALLTKKEFVVYGADVNPDSKSFENHYDWYTRKQLYRYVGVFASAVAPVGTDLIVATTGNTL